MFGRQTQEVPVKRHSDNSSNSLVNNSQHGQHSHTNIPMEQFSVTPIPANHNNHSNSNFNNKEEIEHDPLPPAVDYSGVSPSAKYQFRALGRRALSYHRHQRVTNICCLVLWPIILVLVCFAISVTSGPDSKKSYKLAFCSNEADPATSSSFALNKVPAELISRDNKFHAAWYPSTLFSTRTDRLPCVRWFGNTYPNKAPYENVTAADRAMPDAFYTPPPAGGWFNLDEIRSLQREKTASISRYYAPPPELFNMRDINQTVLYAAANADVARSLGLPANVTETFTSVVWPPTDPKIVFQGPQNATAANGLLSAIPVRYAFEMQYDNESRGNSKDSKRSNKYSAQKFIAVQDGAALDNKIRDVVFKWADDMDGYRSELFKPFGGVYFEAVDVNKQAIQMTMQYGVPPQSGWSNSDDLGSGIRQMVTMTQMTSAMVKIKYAGKYVISQGLRALPYEFDPNWLNGYALNEISLYLFPFGLSFLLPTFVALLVQEKEDRHRAMMAMNGLKSSAYYFAHYFEFMVMQLILCLFFCVTCAAISSQLVLRTNPGILIVVLLCWAHTQATFSFLIASLFSRTRKATLIVYFFVAVSAIMGSVTDFIFKEGGVPFAWYIHPSFAFFNILSSGIRHSSRVNGLNPLVWSDFAPGTTLFACLMILLGEGVLF
ncbi:hypothetical protein BGZ82_008437, partial [Podila clonocystis]